MAHSGTIRRFPPRVNRRRSKKYGGADPEASTDGPDTDVVIACRAVSDAAVETRARLAVCLAALLFSTGGAAIKVTSLTGWQVAGLRSGIAALAVVLFLPRARRGWSASTFLVGIGYAATLILFVQANKLTTAANAIFLQATAPLYLVLIGPWLLREPLRRRDIAFMAALGVGLSLFFTGVEPQRLTAPDPARGNLIAVASGVCWAATVAGLRWIGRNAGAGGSASVAAVAIGNLIAFVVCAPWAWPIERVTTVDVATVLYLGIFQIGAAYAFLTRGLERVAALEASLLLSIEPVLNPVWAWLVHGEVPSAGAIAGGVVILAATVIHSVVAARSVRNAVKTPSASPPA